MLIRAHLGVSLDGYATTPTGYPAIAVTEGGRGLPLFSPGPQSPPLRLLAQRSFPDGTVGLDYSLRD